MALRLEDIKKHAISVFSDPTTKDSLLGDGQRRVAAHLPTLDQPVSAGQVLVGAQLVAEWWGGAGSVKVLRSENDGWISIDRCLQWRLAQLRLGVLLFQKDTRRRRRPRVSLKEGALCLCHLLCTGDHETAREVATELVEQPEAFRVFSTPFEALACFMARRLLGQGDLSNATMKAGIYTDLISNWTSHERVGECLELACGYRLSRIEDPKDEEFLDFDLQPYPLLPAEILAVLSLRQHSGLKQPTLQHEVIAKNPLAAVPRGRNGSLQKDDLLRATLEEIGRL